jgi:DNA-binding NarL/FixJ family response regulator
MDSRMVIGDTVLIVDEDDSSREELARVLDVAGFNVLQAAAGDAALRLARGTAPAALIIEVPLPGLSGYELCQMVKSELGPELPVVILSGARTEPYDRVAGLLLGADDYVVKPFAPGELIVRLRNLIRRSRTTPPSLARKLTAREHEVLTLLGEGLAHREIARRLFISPKTVATHVEHILRKFGVRSRAQAVAVAYREEILRPPTDIAPAGR